MPVWGPGPGDSQKLGSRAVGQAGREEKEGEDPKLTCWCTKLGES